MMQVRLARKRLLFVRPNRLTLATQGKQHPVRGAELPHIAVLSISASPTVHQCLPGQFRGGNGPATVLRRAPAPPNPWPVTVRWRGLEVRREPAGATVIAFPDGQRPSLEGEEARVVEETGARVTADAIMPQGHARAVVDRP
jgi:hypothetical protein